jgi:hypothetical protein
MKNKYEVRGDTTVIFVSYCGQPLECLIDTEDLPLISAFRGTWNVTKDGNTYYVKRETQQQKRKAKVSIHRLITGSDAKRVDHKDGNGLNNQKSNLRDATPGQNRANAGLSSTNTSGYRGVAWHRRIGKWRAVLQGACYQHLGYFDSKDAAARAYDAAALRTFGDFARLNFPSAGSV